METPQQPIPAELERKYREAQAAVDEVTLQRIGFAFMEENIKQLDRNPHEVIKELVAELPDKPRVLTRDEIGEFIEAIRLDNGTRSVLDHGEVTPLESYLVFLLMNKSPKSTQLEVVDATQGDNFSIADSIRILRDQVRTKRFLQGVASSVQSLREQKGAEPIIVCDAGCGAIPILGLYAALQDESVEVICIEHNAEAAAVARTYIDILGLSNRMNVVTGDARSLMLSRPIDLLVSETMDVGLLNESMPEILNHLTQFMSPDSVIIPAEVEILATAVPIEEYADAASFSVVDVDVSPIIDANWQTIHTYKAGEPSPHIDADINLRGTHSECLVLLSTRVTVTPGTPVLDLNESRLTQALPVLQDQTGRVRIVDTYFKDSLHIAYQAGTSPVDIEVG
jgi:precorrin-6B methylase 2